MSITFRISLFSWKISMVLDWTYNSNTTETRHEQFGMKIAVRGRREERDKGRCWRGKALKI